MKRIIPAIFIVSALFMSVIAHASFQLETMTVILDANEQRKVFSVKNTSKEPILLSTKVSDIEGGQLLAKDIIISPPIVRIEPEQSQQINFLLKQGVNLSDEGLLRVSFQGVGAAKTNVTKMPIRQDIAMLIIPQGMNISQKPWDNLKVTQEGNTLKLNNTGKQVIRLAPNFITLPDNTVRELGQFFLRPGEQKQIEVTGNIKEIKISPLSRYGFKTPNDVVIEVSP